MGGGSGIGLEGFGGKNFSKIFGPSGEKITTTNVFLTVLNPFSISAIPIPYGKYWRSNQS